MQMAHGCKTPVDEGVPHRETRCVARAVGNPAGGLA